MYLFASYEVEQNIIKIMKICYLERMSNVFAREEF